MLQARCTPGAAVTALEGGGWRLSIPAGEAGGYRLAQLDDTRGRRRTAFLHQAPGELTVRARVSAPDLPGTWGFGLWNDPFSVGLGLGGAAGRLPALPNAAWFFHASPPNYLALHDEHPAQGLLAAVFRAPRLPGWLLAPGLLAAGLLAVPLLARRVRRLAARVVAEDAAVLDLDVTRWHVYCLRWTTGRAQFWVDGQLVFESGVSPLGRLGRVLWIDNQYAAFPPDGRVRLGTLANPAAWLELGRQDSGTTNCANEDTNCTDAGTTNCANEDTNCADAVTTNYANWGANYANGIGSVDRVY